MEKMYKLSFRWSEKDDDGNLETLTEKIAVSSSKEELIGKVYEWFREERDANADDYGQWEEDKSIFYCFLDEFLIDTVFIIEEVDLLK